MSGKVYFKTSMVAMFGLGQVSAAKLFSQHLYKERHHEPESDYQRGLALAKV